MLLFHPATAAEGIRFFTDRAPGVPVIADPEKLFFSGFGLERASWSQLLGPRSLGRFFGAMARGHFGGLPQGDPMQLPGAFLVRGRQVLWAQRAEHAGEQPDFAAMRRALARSPS